MRRHLNFKAVAVVLGSALLIGLAVNFVHDEQVVRHADALLFQADRALEQNRSERALQYFDHYLKYRPADTDAMVRYGAAIDKYAQNWGDRLKSVLVFTEVLRREPGRTDVRYQLIKGLIKLQRNQETITQAQMLLPDWQTKGEMEHVLGWCYEGIGEFKKAVTWFRRAIALDPGRVESYVLLAETLQHKLNDPEGADEVMDALVKAQPESYQVHLLRRRFLLLRQSVADADKADQDLKQALKLSPHEPAVLLAAATAQQNKLQVGEARKLLRQGIEQHPLEENLYTALARLEIAASQITAAREVIERGLNKVPKSLDLLIMQTDILIDEDKMPLAQRNIDELRRRIPASPLPDYFHARLLMGKRQWPEAIALLERARNQLAPASEWTSRALAQLSLCYEQVGDAEQQLTAIRRAVALEPSWNFARYWLGSTLLTMGRFDEALSELQQVTRQGSIPPGAWNELVRCLVRRNLQLPQKQRQWDEVDRAFEQATAAQPRTVELVILKAEILLAQQRAGLARKLLEGARDEFPRSAALQCALADLALRFQEFEGAIALLEEGQKTLGDSIELRLGWLRLSAQQAGPQARQSLVRMGQNLQSLSAKDRARLLRELAETWTKLGDPRQAEECWRRLAEDQPNDMRARLAQLDLCLQSGRTDAALKIVTELRKLEGERGANWRYGAAALQLAEANASPSKLQQARKLLAEAAKVRRDWGRLPLLEARIDEVEAKFDDAIKHYQAAFKLGETTPTVVRRLVQLLEEQGNFEDAERALRAFEDQFPLTPDLARLGADLALANGNPVRAVTLARLAVPEDSRDYRDHLWLARVHQAAGQPKKAEESFTTATTMGGHSPETWVALVDHLARTQQQAAIAPVLEEMKAELPAALLPATLARCHEVQGQMDQAEKLFEQALASRPNDFVLLVSAADFFRHADLPDKAVPLLQRLVNDATDAPANIKVLARRHLALILASSGRDDGIQHAVSLIDTNLKTKFAPRTDERLRILVQGFDPAQRLSAIKRLQPFVKLPIATADEVFYFTKLCQAAQNRSLTDILLLGLVSGFPDNAQFLAHAARYHLDHGDVAEARNLLQKLERREPDSRRTKELRKLMTQRT